MKELSSFWQEVIGSVGLYGVALSFGVFLFYRLRLLLKSKLTAKYDFASGYETKYYRAAAAIFSFSVGVVIFRQVASIIGTAQQHQFIFAGFMSFAIAFMLWYALAQFFKTYYPFIQEKQLSRIRFKPRKSPKTGKKMRLLTESEEDEHMTQEMIEHEDNRIYEYDVWLDEETGYKLIERYDGSLHALICPKCEFRTMKDYKEEVIKSPSAHEQGVLRKNYKCSYCGFEEMKEVNIAAFLQE